MPAPAPLQGGRERRNVHLQRLVFDRAAELGALYLWPMRGAYASIPEVTSQGELLLQPGSVVSFDTYFNALPELHWRRYCRLERLQLELFARGDLELRVFRRSLASGTILVAHRSFGDLDGPVTI